MLSGSYKPAKIYALMRAPLAGRLPEHLQREGSYIEWITGDPAEPLLGLDPEKYWELLESVDIVVNGAANTKQRQSRMDGIGCNVSFLGFWLTAKRLEKVEKN